jgi:hypothetical protein
MSAIGQAVAIARNAGGDRPQCDGHKADQHGYAPILRRPRNFRVFNAAPGELESRKAVLKKFENLSESG